MVDSVKISFVDENDFVKERKWYFLSENSPCGRLGKQTASKVKNNLSEIDISQQSPDCPSLSPYFLLSAPNPKHYFHKNVKLKLFQKQLVIFSKQILNFRALKLPGNLISFVPRPS